MSVRHFSVRCWKCRGLSEHEGGLMFCHCGAPLINASRAVARGKPELVEVDGVLDDAIHVPDGRRR